MPSAREQMALAHTGSATPPYVTGYFESDEDASLAVDALIDAGFEPGDIAVLASEGGEFEEHEIEHTTGVPVGAATGGAVGAALGAAGAAVAALGGGVPLLASGPLIAALEGGVLGGAGGSLLGSLAGLGYWRKQLDLPEALDRGAVLVGVPAEGERRETASKALVDAGAESVEE